MRNGAISSSFDFPISLPDLRVTGSGSRAEPSVVQPSQTVQRVNRISIKRRSVHKRKGPRRKLREFAYRRTGVRRDAAGVKELFGPLRRLDNVGVRQFRAIAGVSEEIPAEECARGFFK